MPIERRKKIIRLLGVGFDSSDEHVRITKGKNHDILMGSDECHEFLQDLCARIEAGLEEQGKSLDDISPDEFTDFIRSLG